MASLDCADRLARYLRPGKWLDVPLNRIRQMVQAQSCRTAERAEWRRSHVDCDVASSFRTAAAEFPTLSTIF